MHTRFRVQAAGEALRLCPLPRLHAETAACCQSGHPGLSGGDSHLSRRLEPNRMLLAISDGMGSGDAAREESALALKLLFSFLDAGISLPLALETLNQQLLMRCFSAELPKKSLLSIGVMNFVQQKFIISR